MTRVSIYIGALFMAVMLVVYSVSYTGLENSKVDRSIQIKGVFLLVDQPELLQRLQLLSQQYSDRHDFILNVRRMLESEPNVSTSTIRHAWPDLVIIEITEVRPLAIINQNQLLLDGCKLVKYEAEEISISLPMLNMPHDAVNAEQCGHIQDMLVNFRSLSADSITMLTNGDYVLDIGGIKLVVDDDNVESVIGKVRRVAEQIRMQNIHATYVDMRYVSGAAIGRVAGL